MIYAKTTVYGLDAQIKLIQTALDKLLPWSGTVEIYGKIQKTLRDEKVIPEVYISGSDYKELFVNDKVSATIGFIVKDRVYLDIYKPNSKVDVVFTVNLEKIHANSTREDERCLIEAKNALKKTMLFNSISAIKTGIDEVFTGFDRDRIKHRDMQPWFVFSLETEITYSEIINCN